MKYRNTTQNIVRILLFAFLILSTSNAFPQSKSELEQRRRKLQEQIKLTSRLLEETKKDKTETLHSYRALESNIKTRNQLINSIQDEINNSEMQIEEKRDILKLLNNDIQLLQEDYSIILRTQYRQKLSLNKWLQFFSASSFRQAFLKWRLARQFEEYSRRKANQLVTNLNMIQQTIDEIEGLREEKEILLENETSQNSLLSSELREKNNLLIQLESDEKDLLADLAVKERERNNLNSAIEAIIREEIAKRESEARLLETPEAELISTNFSENRGKLPWPVVKGFISLAFGKQKHPSLKNIQITNNGIDIRSEPGAEVKAIFNGEVSGQAFIPGYNNMLVLRHGNFRTVYARLEQIYVKKGEIIEKGQIIGKLAVENQRSELHFEIWNEENKLNPESWLLKP